MHRAHVPVAMAANTHILLGGIIRLTLTNNHAKYGARHHGARRPAGGERLGAQPTPAVGVQLLHHSVSSCGTGRGHLFWWELQVENYTK